VSEATLRIAVAGLALELDGVTAAERASYRPFCTRAAPDLRLSITRRVCERLGRAPAEPKLFPEPGLRRCSFERPGLYGELDLAAGRGRLVIEPRPNALDEALRAALAAALLARDTFLARAPAVRRGVLLIRLGPRARPGDPIVAVAPGRIHATPFCDDGRPPRRHGGAPHRLTCFLRRRGPRGTAEIRPAAAAAGLRAAAIFFADAPPPAARRLARLVRRAVAGRPAITLRGDADRDPWPRMLRWIRAGVA
jgi:hypothetical protein